ncbi:hypothetical protein GCM10020331_026580 [Ectobacillus funiculus]
MERIAAIVERYTTMGIDEISLADTTGMANPKQVYDMLGQLKAGFSKHDVFLCICIIQEEWPLQML